jgi:hypothetical protein
MGIAGFARLVAGAVALLAAALGVCALVAAANHLLSSASLDTSDTRHWRQIAALGAVGIALLGYAAAHAAVCWRPADARAIAARGVFTVAGLATAGLMVRSALNAPPEPGCGMKWLADLAPFLFAAALPVVEAAAWAGWWAGRRGRANPGAALDPPGTSNRR